MKKLIMLIIIGSVFLGLMNSCKKKDDNPGVKKWQLTIIVDLGGQFVVNATADITINGSAFTAAIATSKIGGADEAHNVSIEGTVTNGNTLNVTDQHFTITIGSDLEPVTIVTATCTISGNNITGSGNIEVLPAGIITPIPGTFTLEGQFN
jgi:hypothetical protein